MSIDNPACIFCKIVSGEIPSPHLYHDDFVTAFSDLHPAAPTHILVVPNKHIPAVHAASVEDAEMLGRLFLAAQAVAHTAGLSESGYRLVINNGADAGQSVFHIHMHVLGGRPLAWPPG